MSDETPQAGHILEDGTVTEFWQRAKAYIGQGGLDFYLGTPPGSVVTPVTWQFGDTPELADELLELVLAGRKTGTAGLELGYQAEEEPLPTPEMLNIVLDGQGYPRALLRTDAVEVVPFDEVSAAHAACEGEGDLSLEHWRRVHEEFFRREAAAYGMEFGSTTPVVCERFTVLYSESAER